MAEQRLIDAEELLDRMRLEYAETRKLIEQGEDHLDSLAEGYLEVHQLIKNMPTIDPESLRSVGRWIEEKHKDRVSPTMWHKYSLYHCSLCGRRLIGYRDPADAPYCHCGARMEVQDDEQTD